MSIQVKLFGDLGKTFPRKVLLDYESGLTPAKIIAHLQIDRQKAALILVNGQSKPLEEILQLELQDEDVVTIMSMLDGG
ncbi:MAG: MoaD/ThiS family protein [Firmicutes bacterium]|nr:MoaD/ThiS family protein [Bacillota bacterium]